MERVDCKQISFDSDIQNQKYAKISATNRVERQGIYSPCMLLDDVAQKTMDEMSTQSTWSKCPLTKACNSISSASSLDDDSTQSGMYDSSEGNDELGEDYMKPIRACTIADIYMFEELRKEVGFEIAREWALNQLGPKLLSEASTAQSSMCASRVSSIASRPETPASTIKDWRQAQRKGFSQSDGSVLRDKKKLLYNVMKQNSLPAKVFLAKLNQSSSTIAPGVSSPSGAAFNKKKLTTWTSWKE